MGHTTNDSSAPAHTPSPLGELKLESGQTQGGHELDAPPSIQLFVILFVLIGLVIGVGVLVYNLLATQTDLHNAAAASVESPIRAQQEATDDALLGSWGKITVEGTPDRYHQPLSDAKSQVLKGRGLSAFK